jgi:hypothetical protein
MVHKFIITKKSVNFELHVDGVVELKPLPENEFSRETVELLARMHHVFLQGYLIRHRPNDLLSASLQYFIKNGFDVKDITERS